MDYKIIAFFLVILSFLGYQYYMQKPKYVNGENAPDFSSELLSGENFKLSDQKGKYVLIDFWGTWCPSCKAEMPILKKVAEDFQNVKFDNASELIVLGIALEKKPDGFKDFVEKNDLHWMKHIIDFIGEGSISSSFGVKSVPTKYLINPNGQIMSYGSLANVRKLLEEHIIK